MTLFELAVRRNFGEEAVDVYACGEWTFWRGMPQYVLVEELAGLAKPENYQGGRNVGSRRSTGWENRDLVGRGGGQNSDLPPPYSLFDNAQ
jgi:hypothetical protein